MSTNPEPNETEPAPPEAAAEAAPEAVADPAPAGLIDAAVAAIAKAVKAPRLDAGPVARGADAEHHRPPPGAVVLAVALSGTLEGTVMVAVEDELADRLLYAAQTDDPAVGLRPVADAAVTALKAGGPVDADDPAELDAAEVADRWPEPSPHLSTVAFTGVPEGDTEDERTTMVTVAFALTHHPAPEEDDGLVSGRGTASLSMSGGPAAPVAPAPRRRSAAADSAEGRRLGAVEVGLAGVLGETTVVLHELLGWLPGVIVPLHRDVGMPVDVRIDNATVAHAEIVVVDERYALRVIDVVASARARLARGQMAHPAAQTGDPADDPAGDSAP